MRHQRTRARICRPCVVDLITGSVEKGFLDVQGIIDENRVAPPKVDGGRRPIPMAVRIRILRKHGFKCVRCPAEENLHIDHIMPLSKGGTDDETNLQVLCVRCNLRKGDRI